MELNFDKSILHKIMHKKGEIPIIYFSYMDRKHLQRFILDFKTIQSVPDKTGRENHNVTMEGLTKDVLTHAKYNENQRALFIAPQITLWTSFDIDGINPELFIDNKNEVYFELKVISMRRYKFLKATLV
mgnify:FL=1